MGGMLSSAAVDLASKEAKFVSQTVESNAVVVFSKSHCPHCHTAKGIFSRLGVETTVHELDKMTEGSTVQDVLGEMTPARTVPRVFINGQCIGGCSELKTLLESGKLKNMLQFNQ